MRRLVILFSALLLLAGCATPAKELKGSLTPPAGMGYAIVALAGWAFDPDSATLEADYAGENGQPGGRIYASLLTDSLFGPEGSSPRNGKLALLTLPPGQYRFVQAFGYYKQDMGFWSGQKITRFPMNAPFVVRAGEAVYLGEIWLDLSYRPELQIRGSPLNAPLRYLFGPSEAIQIVHLILGNESTQSVPCVLSEFLKDFMKALLAGDGLCGHCGKSCR